MGCRRHDEENVRCRRNGRRKKEDCMATGAKSRTPEKVAEDSSAPVGRNSHDPVELQRHCGRLSALVELQLAMAAQRKADDVLERVFEAAERILSAAYIALGVDHPHAPGQRWARPRNVSTNWFTGSEQAPRGLLGRMLREQRPLRVSAAQGALAEHELPPQLPPAGSFLAVPLSTAREHHGWLFFARPPGEPAFDELDEHLAATLGGAAATAFENVLLYQLIEQHAATLRIAAEQRQQADAAFRRLNRVHSMRSWIASQIMRIRDQNSLFEEVCRTAVEQGGFRLAWVGVFRDDVLQPVAAHGEGQEFLKQLHGLQLEPAPTSSPAARNLRERRPYVSNDIANDPYMRPWRESALKNNLRSVAVYPLFARDHLAGCLGLYATEPNFFTEEELRLLGDLAGDISYALEFIAREEKVDFLSFYDPVTGLANRRLFQERLGQHVLTARQNGTQLAVAVIDLEQFKLVNDAFGMAAGDEVLRNVGERLIRFAGNALYLARVGGDRFAAVIPELRDTAGLASMLQDRFLTRLTRPIEIDGRVLRLSGKVGIALFPGDGEDAESLFRNAEAALKKAKESGERFLFYTAQMGAAMKKKLELEGLLRHAIETGQFRLYYQPKIDLRSGLVCGCEALLRWNSPELGMVPPAQFVPLLEHSRLIIEVGRWALMQAADDRALWLRQGLPAPKVCVNVSPVQLRERHFQEVVREALERHPENAGSLVLEVTESAVMADPDAMTDKLRELREAGVGIALDDFGTGYSSLSYLSKLPLNAIKIDRSFIVRMTDSADTMSIVSTIISLAHSMSLTVVAEGVDATEQLKFLRLLKCDEMQGFLFSPALPAEEFAALLRSGRRMTLG